MQAHGVRTAAASIALIALLCAIAVAGREPVRDTTSAETPPPQEQVVSPSPSRSSLDDAAPPVVTYDAGERNATPGWLWSALAAVGMAGVAAAGVLLVPELRRWGRARRQRRVVLATEGPSVGEAIEVDEPSAEAEVVERALDAAAGPLREPVDPREAVIEAYAGMERVLAERELGRRAPEAPREYLARVLRERGAPQQSLATLTSLFEEARYSRHPISPSAPRRALGELETARAALAATDPGNAKRPR